MPNEVSLNEVVAEVFNHLARQDGEESDEDVAAQVANIVPSAAAMRVSRLMFEANEEAVCEVFGKPRRPADLSSRPLIGAKMIQLAIDEAVAEAMKSFSPSSIPSTSDPNEKGSDTDEQV
jgi:hypothetical protein